MFRKSCLKSKIIKGIKGIIKRIIPKIICFKFGFFEARKKDRIIKGIKEVGTKWMLATKPAKNMAKGKLKCLLMA